MLCCIRTYHYMGHLWGLTYTAIARILGHYYNCCYHCHFQIHISVLLTLNVVFLSKIVVAYECAYQCTILHVVVLRMYI